MLSFAKSSSTSIWPAFFVVPTFVDCSRDIEHCCIKSRKERVVLEEATPERAALWTSGIGSMAVADEFGPVSQLTEFCVWKKDLSLSKLSDVRTDNADRPLQEVQLTCRASEAERPGTTEGTCLTRDTFEIIGNTPSNSLRHYANAVSRARLHDPGS